MHCFHVFTRRHYGGVFPAIVGFTSFLYICSLRETMNKEVAKRFLVLTALIALCMGIAEYTYAELTISQTVPSSGAITAGPDVGVYTTSQCTTAVTSISWGSIEAGGSTSQTVYVEDTGGAQMAPSISVGSWSPSGASSYVTITWSTLPAEIQPGVSGAIAVTFTCSVTAGAAAGSFSCTITISGTG